MDKSISVFKNIEYDKLFLNFFIKRVRAEYNKNDLFFCFGNQAENTLHFEEIIDPDLCLPWFVVNCLKFHERLFSSDKGKFFEVNLYNYPIIDINIDDGTQLSSLLNDELLMKEWFDSLTSRLAFEKNIDFLSDDLDLLNISITKDGIDNDDMVFSEVVFEDPEINELFNGVCSIFLEVNKKYNTTNGFTYSEIKSGMLNCFLGCNAGDMENGLKLGFYKSFDGKGFSVNVSLFTNAIKSRVMDLIKDCVWLDYCIDFANVCGMGVMVKDAKNTFEFMCKNDFVLVGKSGQVLDDLDLFNKLSERMSHNIEESLVGKIADNLSIYKRKRINMNLSDDYVCSWEGREIIFPLSLGDGVTGADDMVDFVITEFIDSNAELVSLKGNVKSLMAIMILSFLENKNIEEMSYSSDESVLSPSSNYDWEVFSDYWIDSVGFSNEQEKLKQMLEKISSLGITYKNKRIDPNNIYKVLILAEYLKKSTSHHTGLDFLFDIEAVKKRSMRALEHPTVEGYIISALEDGLWKKKIEFIDFEKMMELKKRFPNFKDVIDYYIGAFKIYFKNGSLPSPVLLMGDPGLGKTEFSNMLSSCINVHFIPLQMSSLTAGWIIGGGSAQWRDAKPGVVVTTLLSEERMSALIMLDEIDKVNSGGKQFDPIGSLYPLLESTTAKSFSDEFLELPLDASHLIWIATANEFGGIPEPILDRFVVFKIKQISKEDSKEIVKSIFSELTRSLNVELLGDDVMNYLSSKTPRDIKRILKKAIASAANRNDLIEIHKKDIQEIEKSNMGF